MLALTLTASAAVFGQAPERPPPVDEEIIVQVRSNGVARGDFTLIRRADGDLWIPASDLERLQIQPLREARRERNGETFYSSAALGASKVVFNEEQLTVDIDFTAESLQGTSIDLSDRRLSTAAAAARNSLVLSYRLSMVQSRGAPVEAALETDMNVRWQGILLRQEARLLTAGPGRHLQRGATQAVYDDRTNARRYVAGDVFSTAGAYGSGLTGAGLLLQKVYELTPDVVRHPLPTLQASTSLPAEVEVAVDGRPVYHTRVAPGPIVLNNLPVSGGTHNLRLTITDAAGRREVIEQPFLFTDSVLAQGFHEYSYFVGKRSELDSAGQLQYREPAWQGYHRYGLTDRLTVAAGGEGNRDFHNLGGGITLRSDRLGLLSLDLLSSVTHGGGPHAAGWSARYTYDSRFGSLVFGRRRFESGFRSFGDPATVPFPLGETRLGVSTGFGRLVVSADLARTVTAKERRDTRSLRFSTFLSRAVSVFAEYQTTRVNGTPGWAANLYLRADFDSQRWTSASIRGTAVGQTVEVQAGQQVPAGEGFGYRVGVQSDLGRREDARATLAADWHLRPANLGLFAAAAREGGFTVVQGTAAGALVGLDGFWGLTREVNDAFALVKLGVPQPGVEVLLNNRSRGRTDAQGRLLIPDLSSIGRQDVSINDRDLNILYSLKEKHRTIQPVFRSGSVIDFGIRRVRAVAGVASLIQEGEAKPLVARAWTMRGPAGPVSIETSSAGEFYLEDALPGNYTGTVEGPGNRRYACRMTVPDFPEPVLELKEGILCD
ncbi:MAG TPA: fimbria/pilus outer membrane usher protein [Ramlibacter sp.]|uniref:fimbria/pilus outer membrane usher protein n=1 Tax=Ramlibacter sp. TaxID=1917967 RepID=UPI002D7EFA2C|nr:fimbria/pilus outer membrane usher protein [Ramlibacter sp.]HET8745747.1 fimbria/pilus outer membrane usher protein [Ramlibacter sp.]